MSKVAPWMKPVRQRTHKFYRASGLMPGSLPMSDYANMAQINTQMQPNMGIVSPTSTVSTQEFPNVQIKKKKGYGVVGRSIEEELCLICGDRASGYHYNALSCEGCKGFFRRSITKGATYVCKYGGQCEMDMWMRRKCQACRLRRCREVGMKEECLLSEEQCKARDVRRKSRSTSCSSVQSLESTTSKSEDLNNNVKTVKKERSDSSSDCKSAGRSKSSDSKTLGGLLENHRRISSSEFDFNENPLDRLPTDTRSLIELVVICQDQYEIPQEQEVTRVLALAKCFDPEDPKDARELLFTQLAQYTVLTTQLIVEFAKQMPGFMDLAIEDQIILLKGSACENLMFRTARQYDPEADTIVMADGRAYTRNTMCFAGFETLVPTMFNFCNALAEMKVDNAEFGLLTCISLFSERCGLIDPAKVEKMQDIYTKALEKYCVAKVKFGNRRFAKLLIRNTDLRTLNAIHSEMCLSLKVKSGNFPSILLEYFNVQGMTETQN